MKNKRTHSWSLAIIKGHSSRAALEKRGHPELLPLIEQLFEEEKMYRKVDLRLSEVAKMCCTNRTYLSECINSHYGKTFPMFVNTYRVEHAKKLIRTKGKDSKLTELYEECGFSDNVVFVRVFRKVTGMNPSEWRDKIHYV